MSERLKEGLIKGEDGHIRCFWPGDMPDYLAYHDDEWGLPVADDHRLFEKICLEGFQSGLSWLTILRKRENFREAFSGFDFTLIAKYGKRDVEKLVKNAGIIRHRGKIESTVNNAKRAMEMAEEYGSLGAYFWQFETEPANRHQPQSRNRSYPQGRIQPSRFGC
jgi:DNA-3-methyladenine glycosylase I